MKIAIEEAAQGVTAGDGGPFGAVVVRAGEVIGRAHNEVLKSRDPTAHAEVLAIRRAAGCIRNHDLSGCLLYTTCEPCPMCLGAIAWSRIGRVYFGCTAEDAAGLGFADGEICSMLRRSAPAAAPARRPNVRPGPARGRAGRIERRPPRMKILGRRHCLAVFQRWLRRPGSVLY
jgi:guanine deaminase